MPDHIDDLLASFTAQSLEFRAAANASVPPEKRPIRSRVLSRLRDSADFTRSFVPLLKDCMKAGLEDEAILAAFSTALAADPRFQTLVLEAIEQDRKWGDLFQKGFHSWLDRIHSVVEKLFDTSHPVSRLTASVLLSGTSLFAGYKAIHYAVPEIAPKEIAIPIRAIPQGSPGGLKIPVVASPQPLSVRPEAAGPLKVDVTTGTVLPIDLQPILKQVSAVGDPQRQESAVYYYLQDEKIEERVRKLESTLPELAAGVSSLTRRTDQFQSGLDRAGARVDSLDEGFRSFRQAVSNLQTSTSMTVNEQQSGEVYLQWLDQQGKEAACTFTVTVGKRDGDTYPVSLKPKECAHTLPEECRKREFWNQPAKLEINQPKQIPGLPFHLTVIEGNHRWILRSWVSLRFQPDASAIFNNPVPDSLVAAHASGPGACTPPQE
jgi:hypothetical protein